MSEVEKVPLELWIDDAVVLFDWLMTVDYSSIPVTHKAERQALLDLLTQVEMALPFSPSQEQIDASRARVAEAMGP